MRVAAIVARLKCSNCQRKGQMSVQVQTLRKTVSEGERVRAGLSPADRLMRDIIDLKPGGTVS